MPVSYSTAAGALTIGGVAMFCPAWKVINLQDLWAAAEQRGRDVVIPGTSGVRPRRRRDTVTERTLRMLIVGDVDRTGSPQSNKLTGLYTNVEYLRANVVAPTGSGNGTRSAVLTIPSGSTLTEDVHVTGMTLGDVREDGGWVFATIDLSIPSGRIQ